MPSVITAIALGGSLVGVDVAMLFGVSPRLWRYTPPSRRVAAAA